ncbi:MAG TPA: hypothetical protein PLX83_11230 [bacterium]|nr:hypothetical protein [bacterium]
MMEMLTQMALKEGQPYRTGEGLIMPKFLTPTEIEAEVLLWILGIFTFLVLAIVLMVYLYNRRVKFKEFESEMKALDLEPRAEGTLADLVKRHSLNEPVNVLFSTSLFDEMASAEIRRILSSPAPAQEKQERIDLLYHIRTKTYHPDWLSLTQKGDFPPSPRPPSSA